MPVKRYDGTDWVVVAGDGAPGSPGVVSSATAPANTSILWADTSAAGNNALIPAGGTTGQVLSKTSTSDYATTWSTPTPGALTFITSATAAGSASTLSINNCFSSTYDNYLILSDLKAATGNENFYFKLRASGTDASTNYYYSGFWISTVVSSTLQAVVSNGADVNFRLRDIGAEKALHTLEISNPFNAIDTTILTKGIQSLTGGAVESAFILGSHSTDTSYDGFSLIASTNLTGTVRVYGYSNS
jgi:hypothetical protein